MTLDKFGRHIHHHHEDADEMYLVKDVSNLRGDINSDLDRKLSQLRYASILTFMIHPSNDYFIRFNDAHTFLRLLHTGRLRLLLLEGWKTDMYYFLNHKVFKTLDELYKEPLSPTSCLQLKGTLKSPASGYAVVEYSPWTEEENPFSKVSMQVLEPAEARILEQSIK